MKKISAFLISALLLGTSTAFAANGDVVGHIYSTDILAYVNGQPIDGYNIGGKTAIIAEDLNDYGFCCNYDDECRTLEVQSYFYGRGKSFAEIPRGSVGKILGNVYETDIKVFFNNIEIKGYNIGGRTAICIEDMGDLTDSPNAQYGYSKYLGKHLWSGSDRTISFETFKRNEDEVWGMLARVNYYFVDNVLYAYPDEFSNNLRITTIPGDENSTIYNYTEGFQKNALSHLYLDVNGERTEIGFAVADPNQEMTVMRFYDPEYVLSLTKAAKVPQKSYEEAVKYFTDKYEIAETLENDKYTVLMINDETDGVIFAYINKNGGFVIDKFINDCGDREIQIDFDKERVNVLHHTVHPFAGPHGATTMHYESNLDYYDYE